jgi:hypothetical protein
METLVSKIETQDSYKNKKTVNIHLHIIYLFFKFFYFIYFSICIQNIFIFILLIIRRIRIEKKNWGLRFKKS